MSHRRPVETFWLKKERTSLLTCDLDDTKCAIKNKGLRRFVGVALWKDNTPDSKRAAKGAELYAKFRGLS